ncbi:MAG TPA: sn-glycerol-3-phosphate ABC transporter ATP-binding protein UgpC [Jiangellaceae bacterium]|nr:sn-glycerol-3-phosphate ABC transporter ATP-binding protein UgpC [Jiangellaceae bacterium]
MATLTLDNVTKRYTRSVVAVEDVGFEVTDGEFLVLVGPSGCGKSTLLKLIAGLEDVTTGEIRIDGHRVNELGPRERDIAMVFQSYALYPHLTVRNNIAYPLKVARVDRRQVHHRVAETAELLQLTELLDRRPAELSGGQRQRVAMGRAIVRRPRVFLMDEPLSNLDARLRVQMRAEIANLQRELGITTVYVTHDQVEAMTMGSRVAVLLDGRLQQLAKPRQLYDRPANRFVAGFIGSPPMNLLDGTVVGTDGDLGVEVEGQRLALVDDLLRVVPSPGDAVVLGLRPENMTLVTADLVRRDQTLSATVVLVEELGAEEIVHLRLGDQPEAVGSTLVVRAAGASKLAPGDHAHVIVDPRRFHFFDADHGLALDSPVPRVDGGPDTPSTHGMGQ